MAATNGQFDTTVEIVTPENIAFRYQVAGPFRRLPAYLIDLAIRVVAAVVAMMGMLFIFGIAGIPGVGVGVTLMIWFLLSVFYGGVFETYWNGQTPGKRALQIRVIGVDGQPINGLQAVLRNILRAIDMQPVMFYMVGLLSATMNNRFQRLGDLACGTMVVVEEPQWFRGLVEITEPEALRLAALVPVGFQPSRPLARALATYIQRRTYFPALRRLEIARHLGEPLRDRFGLPHDTDLDQLLCALYHRTFITDRNGEPNGAALSRQPTGSPFASPAARAVADASASTVESSGAREGFRGRGSEFRFTGERPPSESPVPESGVSAPPGP
jgi:uncharacterized RDD family membrane protein YckC